MMVASCPLNYGQPKPSETLGFGAKFWDLVGNGSISRVHLFLVFGGGGFPVLSLASNYCLLGVTDSHHRLRGDVESTGTASFSDWA